MKLRIGYMSQQFSLYEALTVDQNIRFFGGVYGLEGARFAERRAFALEMAGLIGRENALTRDLAGGWRQRLALGCAILHEPPIVFLDEPTGGVDPISRRQFWRLIDHLSQQGTTVLVTTHYLDEAEHCHRIAVMNAGKLAALGTTARAEAGVRRPADRRGAGRTTPSQRDARARTRCRRWRRPACSARRCTPCCATPALTPDGARRPAARQRRDRRRTPSRSSRRSRTSSSTSWRGSRMKKALAVGLKEFRQIRRDRRTLMILLFIPVFFLLLYGYALNFDIKHVRLAVEDRDYSPESRRLVSAFVNSDLLRPGGVGDDATARSSDLMDRDQHPRRAGHPARSSAGDLQRGGRCRSKCSSTARTRTPPRR